MMEEYQSIMKNDVWEVVPRLEGKSVVNLQNQAWSRWQCGKNKGRFVYRGFSQKEGVG